MQVVTLTLAGKAHRPSLAEISEKNTKVFQRLLPGSDLNLSLGKRDRQTGSHLLVSMTEEVVSEGEPQVAPNTVLTEDAVSLRVKVATPVALSPVEFSLGLCVKPTGQARTSLGRRP